MDAAVALVDAYLLSNGYLTAQEYPVIQEVQGGGYRAVTDIDILAVRLPGAARVIVPASDGSDPRAYEPDPVLIGDAPDDWVDFIIGEVKEGRAEFNPGARVQSTILTALRRFAFLPADVALRVTDELLSDGVAHLKKDRVSVRLIAFGSHVDQASSHRYTCITHRQCVEYLLSVRRRYAGALRASQSKHPALSMLQLLDKAGVPLG